MTTRLGARVLVVGSGIVGSHVALAASLRGHRVTLIDRHHQLRGASTANLGAVRLSGRAPGAELEMAIYGRTRWETISKRIPAIGFTAAGSITLLRNDLEIAHAARYVATTGDSLDLEIIPGSAISAFEPAIRGSFPAAMTCRDDAWIRPGAAVPALIHYLQSAEAVTVELGHELIGFDHRSSSPVVVVTSEGRLHADHVFVCPGADVPEPFREASADWPTDLVRLHAIELAPPGHPPRRLVTDSSAFATYPGFSRGWDGDGVGEWVATRSDRGSILVGIHRSTHLDEQPDEGVQAELAARTADAFGGAVQQARRAWSGPVLDHRTEPFLEVDWSPSVTLITGLGDRGNTLAPALALSSMSRLA